MFKRLTWFGLGAAAGASGYVWAQQRVRRELDALGPDHVVVVAAQQAGRAGRQAARVVAGAVSDGRSAMRDREDELIARRDARRPSSADARRPGPLDSDRPDRTSGPSPWPTAGTERSEHRWGTTSAGSDRRTRPARW